MRSNSHSTILDESWQHDIIRRRTRTEAEPRVQCHLQHIQAQAFAPQKLPWDGTEALQVTPPQAQSPPPLPPRNQTPARLTKAPASFFAQPDCPPFQPIGKCIGSLTASPCPDGRPRGSGEAGFPERSGPVGVRRGAGEGGNRASGWVRRGGGWPGLRRFSRRHAWDRQAAYRRGAGRQSSGEGPPRSSSRLAEGEDGRARLLLPPFQPWGGGSLRPETARRP